MKLLIRLLKTTIIIFIILLMSGYFNIKHNYFVIAYIIFVFIKSVLKDKDNRYKVNGKIKKLILFIIFVQVSILILLIIMDYFVW